MQRSRSRLIFTAALAAFGLCAMGTSEARAGYFVADPVVTQNGSIFTWSYQVDIVSVGAETISTNNYFRFYDMGGYIAGSATITGTGSANFSIQENKSDLSPPANELIKGDDPAITNVTFLYTGVTPLSGPNPFTVTFNSTAGLGSSVLKDVYGTSMNQDGLVLTDQTIPVPSLVPEPTALISAGVGLLLLGLSGYANRFRSKIAV
jgi:hypothetical protein